MTLDIEGLAARSALRALIARKIRGLFEEHRPKPIAARVGFVDDNGPKGGVAIRCGITVEIPRRPALHAEHRAESQRLAFDGAFAALARRIERERGRMLDERRRPKKYFVAKRLLSA